MLFNQLFKMLSAFAVVIVGKKFTFIVLLLEVLDQVQHELRQCPRRNRTNIFTKAGFTLSSTGAEENSVARHKPSFLSIGSPKQPDSSNRMLAAGIWTTIKSYVNLP